MAIAEVTDQTEESATTSVRPATAPPRGDFRDAVAVVTGGASGIGRALCTRLGEAGARVVVVDLNDEGAARAAKELAASGITATSRSVDMSDADAVNGLVTDLVEQHGRIDYFFNNAGVGWGGGFDEMSIHEIQRVVAINFSSVLYGTAAVYPVMIQQGSGHIINTASVLGLIPKPIQSVYAATKHAVVGFTTSLSVEAEIHGIAISVVCPGLVNTSIRETSAAILRDETTPGMTPPPNRMMTPEQCAGIILRGVARRKLMIPVAFPRPLWWIYRLSPTAFRALSAPLIMRKLGHRQDSRLGRMYSGAVYRLIRFLRTGRLR